MSDPIKCNACGSEKPRAEFPSAWSRSTGPVCSACKRAGRTTPGLFSGRPPNAPEAPMPAYLAELLPIHLGATRFSGASSSDAASYFVQDANGNDVVSGFLEQNGERRLAILSAMVAAVNKAAERGEL